MAISKTTFGQLPDGRIADLYTLTNAAGAWVSITNYGGILVSICVPDRSGELGDVLLGYDDVSKYCPNDAYMGALIGRVGNRIAGGRATLNGQPLALNCNANGQHLHGGNVGFDRKLWTAEPIEASNSLALNYVSPDGEEHYPGTLAVKVTYTWSDDGALSIHYEATSDADTLVNLTNHAYFNLSGAGTIEEHTLSLNAGRFAVMDASLIPTGELRPVDGTPFDLRAPRLLGEGLKHTDTDEQMRYGGGYDHNFCLDGGGMRAVGRLSSPQTGRFMTIETDQPGVQFYSGNMLGGVHDGKLGRPYAPRDGLCLETQAYPDAVNHEGFPSIVLRAGARYDTTTVYRFGAR